MYLQLLSQNLNQIQNLGNMQNMGNDNMNLQQQIQGLQGQDLNQFLGNLALLQMMSGTAGLGGDMNNTMGTNNENNQDSQ